MCVCVCVCVLLHCKKYLDIFTILYFFINTHCKIKASFYFYVLFFILYSITS